MIHDPKTAEAYHLLRCLILVAMADSVLADAEVAVLEHSLRMLGRLDPELWEQTWAEMQEIRPDPAEVFAAVPEGDSLRRFILREMSSIAFVDGSCHPQEKLLLELASSAFGLDAELERFVGWARRAQELYEEGQALLRPGGAATSR